MDEALRELINAIKDLSPAVWEAALVQVRVQAWLNFGLAGVFILISGLFVYCSRILYRIAKAHTDEEDWGAGATILIVLAILFFIPIVGNLYYGLLYLLSPDWAAIQLILEQVR